MEARVGRLEGSISDITRRLDLLQQAESFSAEFRKQEREHLDEKFVAIERRLEALQNVVSRVGWAITLAVLTAALTFAMKGGFNVTPGPG